MGSPRFVSPGALANNAITQFLMQREALQRQAMLDQLTQEKQAAEIAQGNRRLDLTANEQTQRAQEQEQTRAALEAEREFRRQATTQAQADAMARADADRASREEIARANQEAQNQRAADQNEMRRTLAVIAGAGKADPKQWVMRNGKPVYDVPQPGDAPASRSGTARSLPASSATDIADLDTSLDDVGRLEKDIGSMGGAVPGIMTHVPDVVTEFTGIGAEAKSQQALIDRVKQVIGKALEGGVLRKEDEAKYAKILPTVSDPPQVKKAKIAGLKAAITQKRQRMLENFSSADFDVSKFSGAPTGKADPLGIR